MDEGVLKKKVFLQKHMKELLSRAGILHGFPEKDARGMKV